jgi:predicted metal-dependent phosphoesterase TrpH
VIDLHLHTTASDGRSTPEQLVAEAAAAGVRTIAVTDHDTTDAIGACEAVARSEGLDFVPGIEMTAVDGRRDIHVLGYFIDGDDDELARFLSVQREDRRRRLLEIASTLERLGAPIDTAPITAAASCGRSVGRPMVAAALIDAGHARDVADAFDRFLGEGRPAFVERRGSSPAGVIARIHEAGGVAALAHPGKVGLDALVAPLAESGLDAVEVFHPDHDNEARVRYARLARDHDLLVTGGSDYHGPGSHRESALGRVGLPAREFDRLAARARWRSGQDRG